MGKPKVIDSFSGEYRFLSNFYPCTFVWDRVEWPSVEHAYQAMKTNDRRIRENIRRLPTAGKAKALGKCIKLRPDWPQVRVPFMKKFVDLKFAFESPLAQKLLDTDDAILVEGNTWGDTFWGQVNGKGDNKLGKTLMQRRDRLHQLAAMLHGEQN